MQVEVEVIRMHIKLSCLAGFGCQLLRALAVDRAVRPDLKRQVRKLPNQHNAAQRHTVDAPGSAKRANQFTLRRVALVP